MIFDSAMLNGVPWEIIIKSYRDKLGTAKFPSLEQYANGFFEYVGKAENFFPSSDLQKNFVSSIYPIALHHLKQARQQYQDIDDASKSPDERISAWKLFLADKEKELNLLPLSPLIKSDSHQSGHSEVLTDFENNDILKNFLVEQGLMDIVDIQSLANLACEFLFKSFNKVLPSTGIVFAGFGADQYFPEVIEYQVTGFVRHDFIYSKNDENSCAISHSTPSGIFQFAMTSSIGAFTTGVGDDTFQLVRDAYNTHVKNLLNEVSTENSLSLSVEKIDYFVTKYYEEFEKDWVPKVFATHYHPLKLIIQSLPVPEMVHLAETLIVLQSLKERMTTDSESVGGPVDIAVITKSDGLVWIKRKHYFDSEKNLPYVMRQRALYE